ncbi:MAG TPA: YidC/Oxa1 family membrane protein insertase [Solirubrobacteraceae bacterium]|jgi:YidC/Oxa1 family membrane protein insertase|nr:YidC/Oxa1 family membrane protein insertase [Solirubrobacteraceae bacterium]
MFFVLGNIFQPLIDVFAAVLKFFHDDVGVSWGWAIVLLTVAVRALLIPLTFKQFKSMQKLQQLAPQLKAIQAKYKEDKQRQQQEVMKFYKENEVNPFASCLPLVAQLPVFIGLFYTLRQNLRPDICPQVQTAFQANLVHAHNVSVKAAAGQTTYCTNPAFHHFYHGGAGFLFIPDLTNKATGAVLIALIVLYIGTQLASSLMMATPAMDKMQRQIMLLMPLFFVVLIISFPAGLIVYWITTNTWTIFQQYVVRRRIGPVVPAAATAAGGNGAPADGASSGGLGSMLRNRLKPPDEKEKEPAAVGASRSRSRRESPPPPPPRKKKKRSGRRR